MSHVGPKFTLGNIPDVAKYRERRIHDEDAPKIVELGQAWCELGPRPLVKSFSSSTVKKPGKLPRISKKKMGRSASEDTMHATAKKEEAIPESPPMQTGGDMQTGGASSSSALLLNSQKLGFSLEQGPDKGEDDSGPVEKPAPPYGYLVPPKSLDETVPEADTVLVARLDDIEQTLQRVGERPGRKGRNLSPDASMSSLTTESLPQKEDPHEVRMRERAAVIVGSNLFDDPDNVNLDDMDLEDLEKYDVPDRFEDKTEAEWIEDCNQEPESIHAHVLHFEDGDWVLKECWVRDFQKKRYLCELLGGHIKWVRRLCLRFVKEDPRKWADRIKTAKLKRQQAILQQKLFRYIDAVPSEQMAKMSRIEKEKFVTAGLKILEPRAYQKDPQYQKEQGLEPSSSAEGGTGLENAVASLKQLMFEVEGIYLWSMKLSIMKEAKIMRNGFLDAYVSDKEEFRSLLIPFLPDGQQYRLMQEEARIAAERRNQVEDDVSQRNRQSQQLRSSILSSAGGLNSQALVDVVKRNSAAGLNQSLPLGGARSYRNADSAVSSTVRNTAESQEYHQAKENRDLVLARRTSVMAKDSANVMERRKQIVTDQFTYASSREAKIFFGLVEPMPQVSEFVRERIPRLASQFYEKREKMVRTTFEKFRQVMELSLLDTERGQNIAILQMGLSNADPTQTALKLKQLKKQQQLDQHSVIMGPRREKLLQNQPSAATNAAAASAGSGGGNPQDGDGNGSSWHAKFPKNIFGMNQDWYYNYEHPPRDKEALDFFKDAVELDDLVEHMKSHRTNVHHILQCDWRDFIVSDVVDQCGDSYNFFTDDLEKHLTSEFRPFLRKLDLVLHSQLRVFFQTSLRRWIDFFNIFRNASMNILKVGNFILPDNSIGSGLVERRRKVEQAEREAREKKEREEREAEEQRQREEEEARLRALKAAENSDEEAAPPPPPSKPKDDRTPSMGDGTASLKAVSSKVSRSVSVTSKSFSKRASSKENIFDMETNDADAEYDRKHGSKRPSKTSVMRHRGGNSKEIGRSDLPFPSTVPMPKPLLILHVVFDPSKNDLEFRPTLYEIEDKLVELTLSCADVVSEILAVEFEMVSCCNMPGSHLYQVTKDAPLLQDCVKVMKEIVHLLYQIPERETLEKYQRFIHLFDEPEVLDLKDTDAVLEKLMDLGKAREMIDNLTAMVVTFPLFEVHCYEVQKVYRERIDFLQVKILADLQEDATESMTQIEEDWKACSRRLTDPVQDEQQMSDLKKYLPALQREVINPQLAKQKLVQQQMNVMHDLFYKEIDNKLVERHLECSHWPQTVSIERDKRNQDLTKEQMKFQQVLASEKEQFAIDFQKWKADLEFVKTKMDDFSKAKEYDKIVSGLKDALQDGKKKLEDFRKRETLFNIELSDTEPLEELTDDYEDYYRLWNIAIDFTYQSEEWSSAKFSSLVAAEVTNAVEEWYKKAFTKKRQFEQMPIQLKVATELFDALGAYRTKLPLIQSCCHPAFEVRHWNVIFMEHMDLDMDALPEFNDYSMSLKQLEEQNIMQYMEIISEVSAGAQKEYAYRQSLLGMKTEWESVAFGLLDHKAGTWVLKGIDDVQTLLDDHIMKTQNVRASPFCKPFERECKDWEAKLLYIQESLEQILACQKQWMYLEPIFASEDIVRQMPSEAGKFRRVDERWKETMAILNENPSVIDFADIENVKQNFEEANVRLDQITKGLNDYLETKRLYFPRFFFLSNDELLSILSETKDPTKVQPHMNKAFEGISKVRFDKSNTIIEAMISQEGEVVELLKKVNVNEGENKGNVEKWLLEVEHSMQATLRDITTKSLKSYKQNPRTEWVVSWPGQVVICVDMVMWSELVGAALERKDIKGVFTQICNELSDIVVLVRGDLPKLARRTLGALTTIDVHNRDVVQVLVDIDCQDPAAFDWIAQLRYYWAFPGDITVKVTGKINDRVECEVKIINSCLLYWFEYLGNSERLVITPLTDRCYRTLMGAMDLYYGGAPEGPAGTGKTESVKDLAKALAIQCVVFNCSDGLDFLAMAKFFKGLASSGAWCCFDEFNRINAEVLSVIAQQVMTIQLAIIEKKKRFLFEGTELSLIPTCAVNITMNPGYAGRVELPDNLKALFRPCAMMVPDYAMIGEIFLYSYGFQYAKDLGRKATQALRLSSEQLSPQAHYDFGMRGLKSLLVASGNMKRKYGDQFPEFTLALRGFLDVNLPKFTAADVPLFDGIVSDLFPGVELPPADTELYEKTLTEACVTLGLQPTKYAILKSIQLWETILVRHGLMTVGLPPCGKTSIANMLMYMLEKLQDGENMKPVTTYVINPKSIPKDNLYGSFDENTHEWADGVLALRVRDASSSGEERRQWVMLDGPIDAIWIEDMNTVLDDNKKLCLLSGEIIKLSPVVTMLFEVADLAVASPATVSRCGMVLLEPENVGWRPLVQSWLQALPEHLKTEAVQNQLWNLFDGHVDMTVDFVRKAKLQLPCDNLSIGLHGWMGKQVSRMVECLLYAHAPEPGERDEVPTKPLNPKDLEARIDYVFYFSLVWTIGACIDETQRPRFDSYVREIITGGDGGFLTAEQLREKYDLFETKWKHVPTKMPIPDAEKGSMYDFYIDEHQGKWVPWLNIIKGGDPIPEGSQFHTIIVPTMDTIRNQYIMETNVRKQPKRVHTLFCGLTGTGKTISAQSQILAFGEESYHSIIFSFSAATTSKQTQDMIDGKLEKRRRGIFGPPVKKQGIIFVDDLSMPTKEEYGAQPPIELLRQYMFQSGWYDRKTSEFRTLEALTFVGAMGPPGGGKNTIPARYMWHYNLIYVTSYSPESLIRVFTTIMKWFFQPFPSSVTQGVPNLVKASIDMYEGVGQILRPSPTKSHYTFNLRDLSKIFQGMTLCSKLSLPDVDSLVRCWAHECQRIFSDRLVNEADETLLTDLIKEKMEENFKKKWAQTVKLEPLIFVDFMDSKQTYQEVTSHADLIAKVEGLLVDYNALAKHQMNLVLFLSFVSHVCKIVRVLRLPLGNALCVGVGGSGRKSVATLASSVVEYDLFSIEISKSYGQVDWHDDLRRLLMQVGGKQKPNTFLFSDTQVQKESFLEDISSILNSGEVPNLYTGEDKAMILEMCAKGATADGKMGNTAVLNWYIDQCKKFLHITLCLSPIGSAFRLRLRSYPSLVNCCTIDWFLSWPQEALQNVAERFLRKAFTDEETGQVDETVFKGIVNVCMLMQVGIYQLTERFRNEIRRHYYVTPTSYLELIQAFNGLLGKKKNEVSTAKSRYDVGLEKIRTTEVMVTEMQKELEDLQPVLVKMTKENIEQMVIIEKSTKEANATQKIIAEEEKEANEISAEAEKMQRDCQKDLDEALPALQAAVAALNSLSKGDIVEVKAMKTPPAGVILVSQALCHMFQVEPLMVKDPAGGNKKVADYWEPSKKKLYGDTNLLQKLINYDKDNIEPSVIKAVKPFESNDDFTPDAIAKASKAAAGICKWVRAMVIYDRVAREVEPKRKALAEAEAKMKAAQEKVAIKKAELKEVLDKLKELSDSLEAGKKKQEELQTQETNCKLRLQRADKLISGLGGEKTRWTQSSAKLGEAFVNLAGDILIASGMVAYLGVFTMALRHDEINSWISSLTEEGIPCTSPYKLPDIIGEPIKIRQWVIDKLPNDALSIDNAIMQTNSKRWPLMIDPQLQANKWIRTTCGENLKTLRLTKSDYARHLEVAIQFGKPVLIENIGEVLDPMLQPLLERAIFKAGSLQMLRLGDNTIEYSPDFKLYLTSKLPNPHYAPEVCVTVIILNFVTTFEGLTDAMVAILVAKESPDIERKRQELVVESAASAAQLKEIEDKILYLLSASTGNILDDEELITTLANSKVASVRIEERVVVQEATAKQIAEVRTFNTPVAARSSALFFVVSDLANIESNYQYSLEWFVGIFLDSIDAAEKGRGQARLAALNKSFLSKLYVNICRSLFEKDKLLFSFLMNLKMLEFDQELNRPELNLLMQGGGGGGKPRIEKPATATWLTEVSWTKVLELDKLGDVGCDVFKDFSSRFVANIDGWKTVFESDIPQEASWPEGLNADRYGSSDQTTALEQALIILTFRPDGLVMSIQDMIMEKLGKAYLEPPPFDLMVSYSESKPHIPLIFVLTVGADPMTALLKLADQKAMKERIVLLALGQGQGKKADAAIADSVKSGAWVVLQNCHLAESYMPTLEAACENFNPTEIHPEFRLWLTGMPSPFFPVSILQNGVKMTVEPPKGLKQNLTRAYLGFEDGWLEDSSKPHAFKKMLFGLAFFHAIILERRKFGPLGWNIPYAFSDPDRMISASQLKIFLDSYDEIQWSALNYLVAEANYGGRVTDGQDRRTIKCILSDYYCEDILDDSYKFSISGTYYSPSSKFTKDQCLDFIAELPLQEYPEAFWLHQNADLTAKINEGMAIIKTAVNLLPRDSGGAGKSAEDIYGEKCDEILGEMPAKNFDLEAIQAKYPVDYNESLNTVLPQECGRFNRLLAKMRDTMVNLKRGSKGEVAMTPELDEVGDAFIANKVPASWMKVSFASLKPLGSYVQDVLKRLALFDGWIADGPPFLFWISGFFFTQAFFTGLLQNYARRTKYPIDQCLWNFYVQKRAFEVVAKAESGCYVFGLIMEGARWDDDIMAINESYPKVLFDDLPTMLMKPCLNTEDATPAKVYPSPAYKTSARRGVLSTTGHSTNFIMIVQLPIQEQHSEKYWVRRGVALLSQLDD